MEDINKKINGIEENLKKRREFSDILERKQQELKKEQTRRGGGFLSTAIKHSKIDNMRREIKDLEKEIRTLNTILSHVNLPSDMDIKIGGFATFADYFFDGLIADLFVQGKIKDSLDKLRNTYDRINRIQEVLQTRLGDLNRDLSSLRDKVGRLERGI